MYCGLRGVERPQNWNFYMAFAFFRLAAALQGLHKRALAGEEPNPRSPDTPPAVWGDLSHRTLRGQTRSVCCRGQARLAVNPESSETAGATAECGVSGSLELSA